MIGSERIPRQAFACYETRGAARGKTKWIEVDRASDVAARPLFDSKHLQSRLAKVNSRTNPSNYPLLSLIQRLS